MDKAIRHGKAWVCAESGSIAFIEHECCYFLPKIVGSQREWRNREASQVIPKVVWNSSTISIENIISQLNLTFHVKCEYSFIVYSSILDPLK